jgi:hypothetical protein
VVVVVIVVVVDVLVDEDRLAHAGKVAGVNADE